MATKAIPFPPGVGGSRDFLAECHSSSHGGGFVISDGDDDDTAVETFVAHPVRDIEEVKSFLFLLLSCLFRIP